MPDNKEVEIEVALKDSTSVVLKQIAQEIDNVSRKLVETGRRGSDAFERIRRGADQGGGGTKSANTSLADMNTIMGNLAKSMLGPVGITAGFVALTRAMGNFATQRVQMQALSTDLGFTTASISIMDRTFRRMGMTFEQGRQQMGVWGDKLKELATYKGSSQLFKDLVAMGEGKFAAQLLKTAERNIDQAKDMMLAKGDQMYQQESAARARHYARVIGTNESTVKSYRQTADGVKASHQARYSDSVEYLKKEEEVTNAFNTLWVKSAEVTIKALNEMDGGMFGMSAKLQAFGNLPIFKTLAKWLGQSGEPQAGAPEITNPRVRKQMGLPDLPATETPPGRAAGGPVYSGRAYTVGERGPEVFSPGQSGMILASLPAGQTMKDLSDTEKDSNQSLRDIRDILQKMEEEETPGSGTGASGSSGGATQSDTGGGTTGGGGDDGVTMGGDGGGPTHKRPTRGDRNNNPGNIKYGAFAREHGATGADSQGHAIFPDRETGYRAAEALLGTKAYAGKSLREIGRRWQQAGPGWAETVSKATGIPLDAPLTPEQRSQVARVGIPRAEGTSLGPGTPNLFGPGGKYQLRGEGGPERGGATGARQAAGPMGAKVEAAIAGSFGGDVRERQRQVAGTRKGALDPRLKSALDYASAQTGLTVDVTSGGQRMPGAPGYKGSHRHDVGRAADFNLRDEKGRIVHPDDPRAIAFYEHAARAGVTGGSHSYMDDPTKIHLDIAGGPYRKGRTTARQFAAFNAALERGKAARRQLGPPIPPDQARATVDGSKLGGAPASGRVTASVDFGNMPKPEEKNRNPFFRAKIPTSRMHSSVREGQVLPGDDSYGQWVP